MTQQVSQVLETLQRRKRRLWLGRGETLDQPSTFNRLELRGMVQQQETEPDDAQGVDEGAMHGTEGSIAGGQPAEDGDAQGVDEGDMRATGGNVAGDQPAENGGLWMFQTDVTTVGSSGPGRLAQREGGDTTEGFQRAPLASPSAGSTSSARHINAGLSSVVGTESKVRTFAFSSRRWTVPSHLPTTKEMELPLLRLLGGRWGHTRQLRGETSSQPPAKRTRGTEFWDARLMR